MRASAVSFFQTARQNYAASINAGHLSPGLFEEDAKLALLLDESLFKIEDRVAKAEELLQASEPLLPLRVEIARRRDSMSEEKPNYTAAMSACRATKNEALIIQCESSEREFSIPTVPAGAV